MAPPAHDVFRDADRQRDFTRDGFAVVDGLEPSFLEELDELYEVQKAHAGGEAMPISYSAGLVDLRRRVVEAAGRLLDLVSPRLVRDYRSVLADFMIKEPGARAMEPHRHWSLTDETRHRAITIWAPLDSATEENGCMLLLAGSHQERVYTGLRVYPEAVDRLCAVPVQRGQALVFDNRMLHGSCGNRTDRPRRALATQCVPVGAPLYVCHDQGPLVEIYEVDAQQCLEHIPSAPPRSGRLVGRLPGTRDGMPYYERARILGAHP